MCASLYAASEVTAKVGSGATVKITEATDYPFSDTVRLKVSTAQSVKFPLYLRIPRWCQNASVKVNGKALALAATPLSYAVIHRPWKDGDTVALQLPMRVAVRRWEKNQNSASVDLGPLTFSLKIGERWAKYGNNAAWPEYEVFPTTAWNYGLQLDAAHPANSFKVVRKHGPLASNPFTPQTAPVELRVRGRRIPAWEMDRAGLVGKLQPSPVRSDRPIETINLIPMGAARLRISSFPVIGRGQDAHEWTQPQAASPAR